MLRGRQQLRAHNLPIEFEHAFPCSHDLGTEGVYDRSQSWIFIVTTDAARTGYAPSAKQICETGDRLWMFVTDVPGQGSDA